MRGGARIARSWVKRHNAGSPCGWFEAGAFKASGELRKLLPVEKAESVEGVVGEARVEGSGCATQEYFARNFGIGIFFFLTLLLPVVLYFTFTTFSSSVTAQQR